MNPIMNKSKHAIIIGGGLIGGFTAYYLLDKGWSVTVVDKDRFGEGASKGNCGLIVPNHLLPLNSLDTMLKGLFWMLKKDAPLYIRPQFIPKLISWFSQFANNSRPKSILSSARARHALLQSSFDLFPEFIHAEKVVCDWSLAGSLHVFKSEKAWRGYGKTDAFLRQYNIQAECLDKDAVRKLEPGLGDDICGAWHARQTAHLRPELLLSELRRILEGRGARILEHCPVQSFQSQNGKATAIQTDLETMTADAFVLATGAWSPAFAKSLGCQLPIQPGKGYSITMKPQPNFPKIPCFFEELRVVSTPWSDACRLGGTMEFNGLDSSLNSRRLAALSAGLRHYTTSPKPTGMLDEWCGFRPMTADGLPFMDWSPRLQNVMISAGHNMIGISVGPASGKLVAEIMDHTRPHIDPYPYRLNR
jgi:D-amino-acid dehydrogenase